MHQPPLQNPASPWHAGELAIQHSVGAVDRMDMPGRKFVRTFLLEQHREFYPLLPFVVLGSVDAQGDAWATVRCGEPGFLHSPDPWTLHVAAGRDAADPAEPGLAHGNAVGLLGVDLMTRRRNRLNGSVRRSAGGETDGAFDISVVQSFGNCPRYIQNRSFRWVRPAGAPTQAPVAELASLDESAQALITQADTFYVASYAHGEDGSRQVDVSHRGGKPGFVRINSDGSLTIPDFSGNLFFMTLGNFLVNPKAGLLFIDSGTGEMLQMTGEASVILDSPEIAAFEGAERLWTFKPRRIVRRPDALPMRWSMATDGWSPHLQMTGNWAEAHQRLAVAQLGRPWRPFRVVQMEDESATIRSLYLEPADGMGQAAPLAGQHLPLRLTLADGSELLRSYTLSLAPSDGRYRISVKKQGRASSHLHGLQQGDLIEARAPAGSFTADAALRRPAVLLAAGIGITPLLAMLRHIAHEGRRTRHLRPTWLFQAARTLDERAFDTEIAELMKTSNDRLHWIRTLSQPGPAMAGRDYDHEGHIDMALLKATLPWDDYDFYLCGPDAFMQAIYDGLRSLNVPDGRIHAEAFGPSALKRTHGGTAAKLAPPATQPVRILFADSAKEARWKPGAGNLLEVAEARGVQPAFGCRGGSCGDCRTRILEGRVTYASPPSFAVPEGEALICCAVPAQDTGQALHLEL